MEAKAERVGLWSSGAVVALVLLLGVVAPFVAYDPAGAVAGGVVMLPHPSWRNTAWLRRNPEIEDVLVPLIREGELVEIAPGDQRALSAFIPGGIDGVDQSPQWIHFDNRLEATSITINSPAAAQFVT